MEPMANVIEGKVKTSARLLITEMSIKIRERNSSKVHLRYQVLCTLESR